jgi:hypothetical protein
MRCQWEVICFKVDGRQKPREEANRDYAINRTTTRKSKMRYLIARRVVERTKLGGGKIVMSQTIRQLWAVAPANVLPN